MKQKTAFVFPGQGSQSVGMLDNIAALRPSIQKTFKEASDVLGYDLWALCSQVPREAKSNRITQPALLAAELPCGVWCKK